MRIEQLARHVIFLLYLIVSLYTTYKFLLQIGTPGIYEDFTSNLTTEFLIRRTVFLPIYLIPAILFLFLSRKRRLWEILVIGIPILLILVIVSFGMFPYYSFLGDTSLKAYIFSFIYPPLGFYLLKKFIK